MFFDELDELEEELLEQESLTERVVVYSYEEDEE